MTGRPQTRRPTALPQLLVRSTPDADERRCVECSAFASADEQRAAQSRADARWRARTVAWLERYLKEMRPRLCLDTRPPALLLTRYGETVNPDVVSRMVSAWLKQAELKRKGCCHVPRHTSATHMLESGAAIRFIQQLLCPEKLDTAAIYTEVSIKRLEEVPARCHPSAKGAEEKPLPQIHALRIISRHGC